MAAKALSVSVTTQMEDLIMTTRVRYPVGNPTARMSTDRVAPQRYPSRLIFLEESQMDREMHRR
jgi:hypothetical protein